jgi:hypothetical protein
MMRLNPAWLALPALVALFGCGRSEPPQRTTQIIVQPQAQPVQATAVVAPGPPPPPQSELVPPPPVGAGPVVWQPGHWLLSGKTTSWAWQPDNTARRRPGPDDMGAGQWMQQPGGAGCGRRALGLSSPPSRES